MCVHAVALLTVFVYLFSVLPSLSLLCVDEYFFFPSLNLAECRVLNQNLFGTPLIKNKLKIYYINEKYLKNNFFLIKNILKKSEMYTIFFYIKAFVLCCVIINFRMYLCM